MRMCHESAREALQAKERERTRGTTTTGSHVEGKKIVIDVPRKKCDVRSDMSLRIDTRGSLHVPTLIINLYSERLPVYIHPCVSGGQYGTRQVGVE